MELGGVSEVKRQAQGDLVTFQGRMENCTLDFNPELEPFRPEIAWKILKSPMEFDVWCFL